LIKLLFYAINGTGLGHLTRLLCVAREARELLNSLHLEADIRFITSSEASEIAWDFPVYKFPSKTVAREVGLQKHSFESESKLMISQLMASFAPHVLVVDTVPQGSFREIAFLRDFVERMVYIDRHKDPSVVQSPLFQKHVALYHRILVPDHPTEAQRYPHPSEVREKVRFVGPIHGFTGETALTRTEVREHFGVEPGQRLLYLSGGGGSDSREFLAETARRLADDQCNFVLLGLGPLHREKHPVRKNLICLHGADSRDYFPGVDGALSAAGYNSYQELLAAGVPTVFYHQPKGMDRQDERVELGRMKGWHLGLPDLDPDQALDRLNALFEEEVRERILTSLAQRPAARGRLEAALEILLLQANSPHSPINKNKLYQVARWRWNWEEQREHSFPVVAATARRWLKHICPPDAVTEAEESALIGWHGEERTGGTDLLTWAMRLNGLGEEPGAELMRAWCHNNKVSWGNEPAQRRAISDVLDILQDHFPTQWRELLHEFLSNFKRPYQREALLFLASDLDGREPSGDVPQGLVELRESKAPWGSRELQIFKNSNQREVMR